MADNSQSVTQLRTAFATGRTRPVPWRRNQLLQLKQLVLDHQDSIFTALQTDLGKCPAESEVTETLFAIGEIDHAIKHLRHWTKPRKVWTPLANWPAVSRVVAEPLGVSLIISPWNYPFQLAISPLAAAVAAGCAAVIKPSELTPNVSSVLADLIPQYLDPSVYAVVEGDKTVAADLLQQKFDHIFFTGSEQVGKIVMAAAAQHLTPVTLELGGKCPCFVDRTADLDVAARRIAWGKFLNAGQTCVAPDYLLLDRDIEDVFLPKLVRQIQRFYGDDPQSSPDYGRIVNSGHFQRLTGLLSGGSVWFGGKTDASDRYFGPTLLTAVDLESPLMTEEIFGPLLAVVAVDTRDQAIDFINQRPRPLAAYLFTKDAEAKRAFVQQTSSGGVCINDVTMHMTVPELPFGGVGTSGIGSYHGYAGFRAFSHEKSVLHKSNWFEVPLRYPPYSPLKLKWIRRFL